MLRLEKMMMMMATVVGLSNDAIERILHCDGQKSFHQHF